MSDVVNQVREIQRFFPEASDPLIFSEGSLRYCSYATKIYEKFHIYLKNSLFLMFLFSGEMNAHTFAESISEVTDEEDLKSLTSDKTFQTAQDTLKSVSPNFDYSKSEVDDVLGCNKSKELDAAIASASKTNNELDASVTQSSLSNQPTNKETKNNVSLK